VRSALTVRTEDWDTHQHLLNTPEGVVDLRNGSLVSHDPSLLMRGMTKVTPDLFAIGDFERACPRWLALIRQTAYGRPHIEPFLQRWFGYCLTGDIRHQHLLFIQGAAGTGKSQLLAAVMLLLGSYAQSLPASFLLKSQGGDKRFDMVKIMGKRYGFSDEIQHGATWDETRTSKTASSDTLEAEFKGGANVNFQNTIKLNLAGNHHPHFVSAEAGGLMRRMLLLEMINPPVYGTTAEIENYARVLVNEEGAAILAWCIQGALLDYADEHGHILFELKQPLSAASREYAAESNPIRDWVEAEMQVDPELDIDLLEAFARFREWAREQRDNGLGRMTRRGFKVALKAAYPSVEFALRTTRKDVGKAYIQGFGNRQVDFEAPETSVLEPAS
jgi:putative DNA primase/helicase